MLDDCELMIVEMRPDLGGREGKERECRSATCIEALATEAESGRLRVSPPGAELVRDQVPQLVLGAVEDAEVEGENPWKT